MVAEVVASVVMTAAAERVEGTVTLVATAVAEVVTDWCLR